MRLLPSPGAVAWRRVPRGTSRMDRLLLRDCIASERATKQPRPRFPERLTAVPCSRYWCAEAIARAICFLHLQPCPRALGTCRNLRHSAAERARSRDPSVGVRAFRVRGSGVTQELRCSRTAAQMADMTALQADTSLAVSRSPRRFRGGARLDIFFVAHRSCAHIVLQPSLLGERTPPQPHCAHRFHWIRENTTGSKYPAKVLQQKAMEKAVLEADRSRSIACAIAMLAMKGDRGSSTSRGL